MSARWILVAALLALAALHGAWFAGRRYALVAWVLMALPPLVLALAAMRGTARAGFWAALLALLWFSHAVMAAWATPGDRGWAAGAIVLSLVVVFSASLPGLRARFGRRR
ncbi:MAG TPA: DUF2069 domain-containing protein [Lysobacter sp.]|nr:DUF2069 domain-containing protein [Lysobacter sp.]